MKPNTNAAQMDEIVFENRNKSYGAYFLRKSYNRHLGRALLLSSSILIAGLAYPLVSSYNAGAKARTVTVDVTTNLSAPPKKIEKVELPKLPPKQLTSEVQKRLVFKPPQVVTEEIPDNSDIFNQDILSESTGNEPVSISPIKTVEKPDDVIDIHEEDSPPLTSVEEMPRYPGGEEEREKFLAEQIVYPDMAAQNGIQGNVYVQFVIDTKGNVTDVKLMRGIGGGCDEEALRVVKMMPKWSPGRQNSRTVRVIFNMAIHFKLN